MIRLQQGIISLSIKFCDHPKTFRERFKSSIHNCGLIRKMDGFRQCYVSLLFVERRIFCCLSQFLVIIVAPLWLFYL